MSDLTSNDIRGITISNIVPSHFQFYDGDKIIRIGRDCSLELGTGWLDHNDAATGFFKVVVENIMPQWKAAERMEERAAIVAWLRKVANINPQEPAAKAFVLLLCKAIEGGEYIK